MIKTVQVHLFQCFIHSRLSSIAMNMIWAPKESLASWLSSSASYVQFALLVHMLYTKQLKVCKHLNSFVSHCTPQNIRCPPSNLTVSSTSLGLNCSPALFHTHFLPSDPIRLILVSSDHTTLFQSSRVQY